MMGTRPLRGWLQRLAFSLWYVLFRPPWDTRVTPPELIEAITGEGRLPPGRALDLGCGTGTNSLYMAQHGWQVVGVDFAAPAIRQARRRAQQAGLDDKVQFYVADVSRLDFLTPPFDLAVDIGCLHGLDPAGRSGYRDGLCRLLCPGARYMLYAVESARGCLGRPMGLTPDEVRQLFEPWFRLLRVETGTHRGTRRSAWYWLERQPVGRSTSAG